MSRYIDADAMIARAFQDSERMYLESVAKHTPSIDIVRCKECRHCYLDGEQVKFNACELNHNKVQSDDWYCADGEREDE